jgi:tripartite-type tricarboxylate transporter receptor subunit TctC
MTDTSRVAGQATKETPMISTLREIARLGLVTLALAAGSQAHAQDPFYKGKRLTVLINFDAGSATDIEGRVFARHFARHIEGQPQIIVQNIAGGGGNNGTLYLGEVAPKDGTVMGYITASAWGYASQPQTFRVDFRTYEFIGLQGGTAVYYMRTDVPPGMKTAADLVRAQGLVSGGVGAATGRDLGIRLTLDLLGVPFKHVTGYRSGERARLALQRNEIHLYADTTPGYRSAIEPTMVKSGEVIPLYFNPSWDGRRFSRSKQVDGLAIQPYHEFYRSVKGTMPSGLKWDTYLSLTTFETSMQRLFVLPPGAPPDAVAALRSALMGLGNDPAYAEDATKTMGYVPEYAAAPDTNETVRHALSVRPEIRTFVADYIKQLGH